MFEEKIINSPANSEETASAGVPEQPKKESSVPELNSVSISFVPLTVSAGGRLNSSPPVSPLVIDNAEPERSGGLLRTFRVTIASALLKVSTSLADSWLAITGAKEGDRIAVAESFARSNPGPIAQLLNSLKISERAYISAAGKYSPLTAYRLILEISPEESALKEHYLFAALREKSPGAFDALKAFNLSNAVDLERLFDAAVKNDALPALRIFCPFRPRLEAGFATALNKLLTRDPLIIAGNPDILPLLDESQRQTLRSFLIRKEPGVFFNLLFRHKAEICPDAGDLKSSAQMFLLHHGTKLIDNLDRFSSLDKDVKRALSDELQKHYPKATLEAFSTLVAWGGDAIRVHPEMSDDYIKRYWKRILVHRETIGFTDPERIRSLLIEKCNTHPKKVFEALPELNLSNAPYKDEIATTLATKRPSDSKKIAEILDITAPLTLEALVVTYSEKRAANAELWMRRLNLNLSPESLSTLKRNIAASNPWKALENAVKGPGTDSKALYEIVSRCSEASALKLCQQRDALLSLPQNVREQAFIKCGKRNLWTALKFASNFNIAGSDAAKKVFAIASKRNPLRALEFADTLKLNGTEEHRHALLHAVAKNASATVGLLKKAKLPADLKTDLLCRAVRRNSQAIQGAKSDIKNLPPYNTASVIAAASRGNLDRAFEHLRDLRLVCDRSMLVAACTLENYKNARTSAPPETRELFSDPSHLEFVVSQGILNGRWDSALEAARDLSKLKALRDAEVTTTEALSITDSISRAILGRTDLSESEKENAVLFEKIRKAKCIPTDLIQKTLDHFGPDDHPFIFDVLNQGGSTVAELTCEVLLNAYGNDVDILPIDQSIIGESIKLGFRGLSPSLLKQLRPLFEGSVLEGRTALRNYQSLAARVLMGEPISEDLERSPLYPGIVNSAFKPVGMTASQVARLLKEVRDHSEHLVPFKFPKEGYPIRLAATTRIELHPGQQADAELYESLRGVFAGSGKGEEAAEDLSQAELFKRVLQGAFDQLKPRAVWQLFLRELDDPRISDAIKHFSSRAASETEPARLAKMLSAAHEAFSVVTYDAVMELAKKAVSDSTPPEKRFQLRGKTESQIRRVLRLPAGKEIGEKDFLSALDAQAGKLFGAERKSIQREARKFSQHFGDLKDRYVMQLSKSKPAYFGRAGAGLCTAQENWSWNSPTFLQMILIDKDKNKIVGNIQLHLFDNQAGEKSILARLNPTSSFLSAVDKNRLAAEMLKAVWKFSDDNGLIPYLPVQTAWHELTNRDSFAPPLKRYYGQKESTGVRVTGSKTVNPVYRMKREPGIAA